MSKLIYKILTNPKLKSDNQSVLNNLIIVIKKSKKDQLNQKSEFLDEVFKLLDPVYLNLARENIFDLIEIVRSLVRYSDKMDKELNINALARNLIRNQRIRTYKFNGLNRAIVQIFKILKASSKDFNLKRIKLFSEDQLLNINKKVIHSRYPDIKKSEIAQIKMSRKEIKIIEELNKKLPKDLQQKCTECDTPIKYLPVFQFHHKNARKNFLG